MRSTYAVLSYSYTIATAKLMAKVFTETEKNTDMWYLTQGGGGAGESVRMAHVMCPSLQRL